ncbi:MAG: M48 family metallopeptidase [Desulfomonile tiedjei]|nr:M48 family metallopeptidase [Desulfomonile tiedjei]
MRSEPRWVSTLWRSLPLVVLAMISACATVPHTGRNQFNMVSDAQLNELALKVFDEIGSKEPASTDKRLGEIVKRVVDRVSKAAESLDGPAFKWDIRVIDKDIPNAFCLPGGKIVVYSGIVPYAKNEAGLAAVVAHEVAHAVARHGGERLSQKLALRGAITAGGEVLKGKDGKLDPKVQMALGALGMGATIGVVLPYSRLHELEADRIGQIYLAKAGYDPATAIDLWDRMSKIKKPPIPVWLSTHPADEERVEKLRESLPETQKYYDAATAKYGRGVPL